MSSWMKSGDARALKCLLALALIYALMAFAAYIVVHMSYVRPLPDDANPARFSEGRALRHLRRLTVDIDGRQVSCWNILYHPMDEFFPFEIGFRGFDLIPGVSRRVGRGWRRRRSILKGN